jgi:hypothetical protein
MTDGQPRNVLNKLPLLAAKLPRRAQFSSISQRKPDIRHLRTCDFVSGYISVTNDHYRFDCKGTGWAGRYHNSLFSKNLEIAHYKVGYFD